MSTKHPLCKNPECQDGLFDNYHPHNGENWSACTTCGAQKALDEQGIISREVIPFRRICLFAGPGAGKSTTAHWLMYALKSRMIDAEMSREWIKRWAYARREMDRLTDQVIVMGRQVEEELEAIATGCIVVTDSPVLLQAAYAEHQQDIERAVIIEKGLQEKYPTCNIFLNRGSRNFNQRGRWENAGVAGARDVAVMSLLTDNKFPFYLCETGNEDHLLRIITGRVQPTIEGAQ